MSQKSPIQDVAVNRRARHDYFIEETYEAGVALTGSEIKSVRAGRANLRGAYVRVDSGEAWLLEAHISPYEQSGIYFNHEPKRPRKLLLHRREIERIRGKQELKGLTVIPLRLYIKGRRAKVEIGVARGKKLHDKREAIAERDARRQIERAIREHNRG